jgi:hypothetical protein
MILDESTLGKEPKRLTPILSLETLSLQPSVYLSGWPQPEIVFVSAISSSVR